MCDYPDVQSGSPRERGAGPSYGSLAVRGGAAFGSTGVAHTGRDATLAHALMARGQPRAHFDSAEYFMATPSNFMATPAFHHVGRLDAASPDQDYAAYMQERLRWEQYEASDADHDYFSRLAAGQPRPCDEDAPMEGGCDADCGAMDLDSENMMVPASPLQKRSPAAVLGGREAKRARLAEL
jgi:hypothetical protein